MNNKTINVPLTADQLDFMINRIHVDNSFRKYLKDYLDELKKEK